MQLENSFEKSGLFFLKIIKNIYRFLKPVCILGCLISVTKENIQRKEFLLWKQLQDLSQLSRNKKGIC